MKRFLFLAFISILASCNSGGGNPACEWQTFETHGKIIAITPFKEEGKNLHSIKLKFNSSSLKAEPQYLEKLQNLEIDSAFITRNRMAVGIKYKFTVHEAISGNCKSPIITFHHNLK